MWSRLAVVGASRHSSLRQVVRHASLAPSSRIGVIGAPFEKGQPKPGVQEGPDVLRKTGLISRLLELGHDVVDYGDVRDDLKVPYITGSDGERDFDRVLQYSQRLSEVVTSILGDKRLCLTLGGDHSIAIGTIAGHAASLTPDQQLGILWIDAHADLNTGSTSGTGNMHGMSLGLLLRELSNNVSPQGFPPSCVSAANCAYIGLRDLDPAEAATIERLGMKAFTMADVDRIGAAEAVARCLDHIAPSSSRPLHLSFDVDALDPAQAPATGTAVQGGLTVREGCVIVEAALASGHLSAMDLVEVNPSLADSQGVRQTVAAARTILLAALAGHRGT